eukprot:2888487-Amphidinium_carterae.1
MVLPGLHTYEEVSIDQAVQTRYDVHDQSSLIIGEIEELAPLGLAHMPPRGHEELSTQAYVPKQLRQPHQATALEIQEHRVTHLPYTGVQELVPDMCEGQGTAQPP